MRPEKGENNMGTLISVILPTYNENENITELVGRIDRELSRFKHEIIIVDDNSPDGTWKTVKGLGVIFPVKAIMRKERGLASAIKRGMDESNGDVIVVMDSDFSHPPELIPVLLQNMKNADLVVASRFVKNGGSESRLNFFTLLLNSMIRFILGLKIKDLTGGFFAIRRTFLKDADPKIFSGYGDYFFKLVHNMERRGARMKEVPFVYKKRMNGKSKTKIIETAVRYLLGALSTRISG